MDRCFSACERSIYNIIANGVEAWRGLILFEVVVNISGTENTTLLEDPIGQGQGQFFIAGFGRSAEERIDSFSCAVRETEKSRTSDPCLTGLCFRRNHC